MFGSDGTVYVGSTDSTMYALNVTTGTLKWSTELSAAIVAPASIGQNGSLIVPCTDYNIYALTDM